MNEGNFVSRISWFATGDSFLAEREIPLPAATLLGPIAALDQTISGTYSQAEVQAISDKVDEILAALQSGEVAFDDGETATFQFEVPLDYDPESDRLAVRFILEPSADASHTTDIGFTTAQSIFRDGAAEDSTVATAVAETAVASTDQLVREAVLDISGGDYQPGDVVRRTLDVNNSGTTELRVIGVSLIYGSTLRMYDTAQNERELGD